MTLSKYARKRKEHLLTEEEIEGTLKIIPDMDDYYASSEGKIYHKYDENQYHPLKTYLMDCGYEYVTLTLKKVGKKTKRVHRLVALAHIPNPNNLPVVGHKDNIKTNNKIENLYWTTYSENTQKAVNDGLLVNDKGYEDSQSIPVICYDYKTMQEIARYGSVKEAHRNIGVSSSTILRQCRNEVKSSRCGYWFKFQNKENL